MDYLMKCYEMDTISYARNMINGLRKMSKRIEDHLKKTAQIIIKNMKDFWRAEDFYGQVFEEVNKREWKESDRLEVDKMKNADWYENDFMVENEDTIIQICQLSKEQKYCRHQVQIIWKNIKST